MDILKVVEYIEPTYINIKNNCITNKKWNKNNIHIIKI
jgi:hypothetical protein